MDNIEFGELKICAKDIKRSMTLSKEQFKLLLDACREYKDKSLWKELIALCERLKNGIIRENKKQELLKIQEKKKEEEEGL